MTQNENLAAGAAPGPSDARPRSGEELWDEYLDQVEYEPSAQGAIAFAFERLTTVAQETLEPTHAMVLAGARSIGNTVHYDNHMERAKECWRAMNAARVGVVEPKPNTSISPPPPTAPAQADADFVDAVGWLLDAIKSEVHHLDDKPLLKSRLPVVEKALLAASALPSTSRVSDDDCSCGGGDLSGHDTACPYSVSSTQSGDGK